MCKVGFSMNLVFLSPLDVSENIHLQFPLKLMGGVHLNHIGVFKVSAYINKIGDTMGALSLYCSLSHFLARMQ